MDLNSPIENIFGFSADQQSQSEASSDLGKLVTKLNQLNQKLNINATIMPSHMTGMILVLKINESDFSQLAQAINANHHYDALARIGYIKTFKFSKSA